MKNILIMIFMLLLVVACGGQTGGNQATGKLALAVKNAVVFDPNIDHSRIDYFLVSISGEGVAEPIKQKFGFDAEGATIEGLIAGKTVDVTIEAVNFNGYVILRGTQTGVAIGEDTTSVANISVNAVPVFANVGHNATVYANRFVPKIFAPQNVTFNVSSTVNGSESILQDSLSGDVNFSTSAGDPNFIQTIYSAPLQAGPVELTVSDVTTNESTSIIVNVIDSGTVQGLPTTAGGFVGSLMSVDANNKPTNMAGYFEGVVK